MFTTDLLEYPLGGVLDLLLRGEYDRERDLDLPYLLFRLSRERDLERDRRDRDDREGVERLTEGDGLRLLLCKREEIIPSAGGRVGP